MSPTPARSCAGTQGHSTTELQTQSFFILRQGLIQFPRLASNLRSFCFSLSSSQGYRCALPCLAKEQVLAGEIESGAVRDTPKGGEAMLLHWLSETLSPVTFFTHSHLAPLPSSTSIRTWPSLCSVKNLEYQDLGKDT